MPASAGNGQAFFSQGKTRLVKQCSCKSSKLPLVPDMIGWNENQRLEIDTVCLVFGVFLNRADAIGLSFSLAE